MAKYKSLGPVQKKLQRWAKDMPNEAKEALERAGYMVRRVVINEHLSGPKMPRGVGSLREATLQPRTGTLRRSIRVRTRKAGSKVQVFIGTDVRYALVHEQGGAHHPKRPFLAPSVNKKRSAVVDFLMRQMMESYRRQR